MTGTRSRHRSNAHKDSLEKASRDVTAAFKILGIRYREADMIALQLGQLMELVEHIDRGEHTRAANEWADQISIAWQALQHHGVTDVETFVVRRIREKIIPAAATSIKKYRLTGDTA